MSEDVWIELAVAARILRVQPEAVRDLCRRKQISYRNRGLGLVPRYLVLRREIEAMRDSRTFHRQQSQQSPRS